MDEWTKSRLTLLYATGGAVLLAILLLTVGTTWLNADDKLVGRTSAVPLDMLMDQRTYALDVWLKAGPHGRRNACGTVGGMRINIALSER